MARRHRTTRFATPAVILALVVAGATPAQPPDPSSSAAGNVVAASAGASGDEAGAPLDPVEPASRRVRVRASEAGWE